MKTFLKKHFIGAFALVLALATMSFKYAEKQTLVYNWYPVGTDGSTITSSTPLAGEPNEDACNPDNSQSICAIEIQLNPSNPFPSTVAQAQANHDVGDLTRREE